MDRSRQSAIADIDLFRTRLILSEDKLYCSLLPVSPKPDKRDFIKGHFMAYTIHKVTLEEEFKNCPLCNYRDGFHSMLKCDGDEIKWLFICPACHEVFDVGQTLK